MSQGGKLTAEAVAFARALAHLEADPALRGPDGLAKDLVRPLFRLGLLPGVRGLVRGGISLVLPGAQEFLTARSRALDAIVEEELLRAPEQFVVLGAGLDSRPYRMRERLSAVRTFEVDLPATAAWKRARLARWDEPIGHVTFVGVDFARESLEERLLAHDFAPDARTLFLWEGVTYYLPEAAVRATLAVLGRSAPGSALAFDFALADGLAHPARYRSAAVLKLFAALAGEPLLFGMEPEELDKLLAPAGFSLVAVWGPAELAQRFLAPAARARICGLFGVAHARRAGPA